ncbi:MAG: hypothetical protein JWN44_634 [Myxococcales bacterium]|nr:hypothetical protein [Myxococcales bacterium]
MRSRETLVSLLLGILVMGALCASESGLRCVGSTPRHGAQGRDRDAGSTAAAMSAGPDALAATFAAPDAPTLHADAVTGALTLSIPATPPASRPTADSIRVAHTQAPLYLRHLVLLL